MPAVTPLQGPVQGLPLSGLTDTVTVEARAALPFPAAPCLTLPDWPRPV